MQVLLIGSSKVQQEHFSQIILGCGCNPTVASSGEEATAILSAGSHYNLICSSAVLIDMSGAELCKTVRSNANHLITPIIILTMGGEDVVSDCIEAGATDVFSKTESDAFRNYLNRIIRYGKTHIFQTNENSKAMLVEDSKVQAIQVVDWLKEIPLSCDCFESAEGAVSAYQQGKYDILITDVVLKGTMSGLRLARKIREEFEDLSLPILVISGFPDASRMLDVYCAGADDYIAKPPNRHELIARVTHLLGKNHKTQ